MIKKVFALLVVLGTVAGGCLARAEENFGAWYYCAVSELNVREDSSTSSREVAVLYSGDVVQATGKTNGYWIEVQTDKTTVTYWGHEKQEESPPIKGWVMITYLSLDEPYTNQLGAVNANKVRVREYPSTKAKRVLETGAGDEVQVLALISWNDEAWCRVLTKDKKGWIKLEFLDIVWEE